MNGVKIYVVISMLYRAHLHVHSTGSAEQYCHIHWLSSGSKPKGFRYTIGRIPIDSWCTSHVSLIMIELYFIMGLNLIGQLSYYPVRMRKGKVIGCVIVVVVVVVSTKIYHISRYRRQSDL